MFVFTIMQLNQFTLLLNNNDVRPITNCDECEVVLTDWIHIHNLT